MTLGVNSSFSSKNPLLQLAWDATSMSAFKECPRKYYYSIICGYQGADENVHLKFGILYHSAHEHYDKARALGLQHDHALRETVRFTLSSTWNSDLRRPWNSGDPNKNRLTLVRSIVWHLEQFKEDPAKTVILPDKRAAVELSFRYETTYRTQDNESIIWCGHMDRLIELSGQTFVLDYKTTKFNVDAPEYFSFYSPDNQMSGYSFAGRIVYSIPVQGVIVDAAQVMVGFTRFRRGFATRNEAQLEEWYSDLGHWLRLAETYSRAGHFPLNETACGRYGGCPFRPICGKDPKIRDQWLKASFTQRQWNPLIARSEI